MKKLVIYLFLNLLYFPIWAQYTVSGNPYVYTDNVAGTGIDKVFLLNTLPGATITYSSTASVVRFYRYQFTATDRVRIPDSEIMTSSAGNETTYTVLNLQDSRGYMIEENGNVKYVLWIIDYTQHQPVLNSIEPVEDDFKCYSLSLSVNKSDDLFFYGYNNANAEVKMPVIRKYTLSYNTMQWDETNKKFNPQTITTQPARVNNTIGVNAPLADTKFTLRGDQFGEYFKIAKSVSSSTYSAVAVEAHINAKQQERDSPTEINPPDIPLGGSAPAIIDFNGIGNDPVPSYYTWFIYFGKDQANPIARYTDQNIRYTFQQEGDYTVMLEVADRTSTCADSTSVSFSMSKYALDVPNYFSPGNNKNGQTNYFRVSYQSVSKFKCSIFNRWGVKVYESTDPAQGWDGSYNGSYVNTGAYYYVIEATDGNGKKHLKSGDLNILRKR